MLNEIRIGHPSQETIKAFKALSRLPKYPPNVSPVELSVIRSSVPFDTF
jgi:hypothetical protein